jgi:hypothetical protein
MGKDSCGWTNWTVQRSNPTFCLCRAKFFFAVLPQVPFPLVYPLNPSSFFAPGTPYILLFLTSLSPRPPCPHKLLLSSLLSHSLYLQSAVLSKIRFVSLPSPAPDITLTELSQLHIRYETETVCFKSSPRGRHYLTCITSLYGALLEQFIAIYTF